MQGMTRRRALEHCLTLLEAQARCFSTNFSLLCAREGYEQAQGETVEAMDLMRDDISNTFRQDYRGKYKNTTSNQMLFLAAVNGYFRDLGDENVLDPTYDNTAAVDVTSQRNAWIDSGKAEAAEWDDGTVISTPYKRKVFLGGDVKILGTMTDFQFVVTLM